MPRPAWNDLRLNRRKFVSATMAGSVGVMLAACGRSNDPAPKLDQAITAAEKARPHTGRTVTSTLTPQPATIDLAARSRDRGPTGTRFPVH